jgi:hypothetical protein
MFYKGIGYYLRSIRKPKYLDMFICIWVPSTHFNFYSGQPLGR